MKKIIILSSIVSVALANATTLEDIKQAYKASEYDKSFLLAKEFIKQNPEDINANLYLATSAYLKGNFHEALLAYERVSILNPDNVYARIQTAKIYKKTHNQAMLDLELEYLSSLELNAYEKEQVQKLKSPKKTSTNPSENFSGSISLGALYDSNVRADIGDKTFSPKGLGLALRGNEKQKALAHFENLYLQAQTKLNDKISLKGALALYNKDYFKKEYKSYDLSDVNVHVSPSFTEKDYSLSLPMTFEKTFLDYKSFSQSMGIGFSIDKFYKASSLQGGFGYKTNLYSKSIDANKGKDFNEGYIFASFTKLAQSYQIKSTLRYHKTKEKKDFRSDISYDSFSLSLDFYKKLLSSLYAKARLKASHYQYKDFNDKFQNKRKDRIFGVNLGLDWTLTHNSSLSTGLSYVNKFSNQDIYTYDKLNANIYYTYRF